ncbi:MAG: hypothetical protein P8Z76_21350, partial [Alphaproteobacteria bacterium]
VFRNNISLGNGLVDIFEGLFDPLAAPPQSIEEICRNTWKDNGYVSELIPALCFSVPGELEDENVCALEDDD